MKSGTTSLFGFLQGHPDVFMANPKELNFFLDQGNWARGTGWYSERFIDSEGALAVGEVSPTYAQTHLYPEVPERMAALIPDARLILLVREPIERIRSMYAHMSIDGLEELPIDEAVVANCDYVETSRYIRHIRAFEEWFPRSQIHVCISERLRDDPIGQLDEIASFVGVPKWTEAGISPSDDRNLTSRRMLESRTGVGLKSHPWYWNGLNRSWRLRELHRRVFERPVAVPDTSMDPTIELELRSVLDEDTAELEQWLGSSIEEWRVPTGDGPLP
ncbi:MAG: sulfotransferase domain-containing protein [Actinomycetia bacterium]|nr:sulfotransferase domain-containing protein [Actinomycetes bacterium]